MTIFKLQQISMAYNSSPILDKADLLIKKRQRIAVLGRNGAGKTTLFKIIEGEIEADSGNIEREQTKVARMTQKPPRDLSKTVNQHVRNKLSVKNIQTSEHNIDKAITQCQLKGDDKLSTMSGGQLRRVSLAQALAEEPDILLLDEPTNHLDIETIDWLENFLLKSQLTLMIISHDRTFIEKVATHIVEIDRGKIHAYSCNYKKFLEEREHRLSTEKKHNDLFDKRLSEEEKWIRTGIKARRTRNEGRVRALIELRKEHQQRRNATGNAKFSQQNVHHSGKQVIVAENITIRYQDITLVNNFSCIVHRQDRIGIIGPNGSGKSTLIECLLGNIVPTTGTVNQGTTLDIAYFDQQRASLEDHETPMDIVGGGKTEIQINGKSKHIIGYLQDFLFTPEQSRRPIRHLSGGERNRLLLAKLFSKPSNLLVLDEPTNDLDIETLELLEDYLLGYKGTILVISHDRTLLNNIATQTWRFSDNGKIIQCAGGYDDTIKQDLSITSFTEKNKTVKKLGITYEERKELKKIPNKITKLEEKIASLTTELSEVDFHSDKEKTQDLQTIITEQQKNLDTLYKRWEFLSDKESK
jgi:ABC transport system ATP-binding/permease protein